MVHRLGLSIALIAVCVLAVSPAVAQGATTGQIEGVVMDAESGEVLALASLPDFDPNHPGASPDTTRFNRSTLGFGNSPSNGSHNVGQEIDFAVSYKLNRHVSVAGGFSKLFGGGVFDSFSKKDTEWGFAQVAFTY